MKDYVMQTPEDNYKTGVSAERIEAFVGKMMSEWEVVLLLQDILESGLIHVLPSEFLSYCAYYAEMGLISTTNRARH